MGKRVGPLVDVPQSWAAFHAPPFDLAHLWCCNRCNNGKLIMELQVVLLLNSVRLDYRQKITNRTDHGGQQIEIRRQWPTE